MAINKLKDRQIENLPLGPKGKAKLHADGGGLFVNVRGEPRSESRSYVFKGTLHGEQLTKYIGATAKTSLAGARAERDKFNEQIKAGKDPRKEAAKRKAKQRSTAERTVASMLDRYFEKRIERRRKYDTDEKQEERCRKATRHLNLIRDKLGKVPVAEVDTEMLTTNLPGFEEWSGAELRMHIRRAFAHVVALGWRNGCDPKNPASKEILDELLPNEYRKREPRASLSYTDAPRFIAAVKARKNQGMGKEGNDLVTTAPLLFLVHTGVRTDEVRQARWGEIDRDNMLWNVPRDHRKLGHTKDKIRAVPISKPMLEVLEGQKKIYGGKPEADDLIFPGGAQYGGVGRGVINGFIKNTLKWDVHITPHGFRATLNAWATAQRCYHPSLIQKQFDHLGKKSEDDDKWLRPSMADKHYSHSDVDPTIEGERGRREMVERYGEYLTSYKDCTDEQH